MSDNGYLPVSVEAAREIARAFHKQVVVILALDRVYQLTHITTYGTNAAYKDVAARIGEELSGQHASEEGRDTYQDFRASDEAKAAERIEQLTDEIERLKKLLDRPTSG